MTNEREQELERLEKELLADILKEDDDLLSDIPIELLDTVPVSWEDTEDLLKDDFLLTEQETVNEPYPEEDAQPPMKQGKKKNGKTKAQEDKTLIALMLVASFLCLGIIGVMVYWLELLPA